MKGWRLVVLLCTTLLCEPVRSLDKWSRPDIIEKRVDDWVPITASCPSCNKNLESNEGSVVDEIGSLLNPPAIPSGRSFDFNAKQNSFKRAPAGEPYEVTTPSSQFFNQQQPQKIPQTVQFPVSFFSQQNPFQSRFQGVPNFQPQFTFIPQPQIQPLPKENKVTFPESPFIQQQNKGSVQLVYVPIEALQRQKPRFQADRPIPQQSQLEVKTQSPFETGKLKFQRPPQPFDPSRFPNSQQFEQDPNRFAPPPPPASFEQDTSRFPPPSQLFKQEKPTFPSQQKETRPEFLPQNEQPVAPQSYQFVEDARNPPSNFFQFHDNRFQKPSIEEGKPKESKLQVQPTFVPNTDGTRQEPIQSFISNFDGNRPRQEPPQNFQSNFQETRPRKEQLPQNFQQSFPETKPRHEHQTQNFQPNFQETRPRNDPRSQNNQQNFQETRPRQEPLAPPPPPPQFVPKFEEPKLEPQQQFIPNFQDSRPRPEPPQLIPDFQEIPQQEVSQQIFSPDFESLRPKPEVAQNVVPNFQETIPKQEPQESFVPHFENIKPKLTPKVELTLPSTPLPQQTFSLPSSTEQITPPTSYPPPHQPPLSVYMEKRLDNKINEVLTILKDAKTIPVLDTIGNRSPKVFVGPTDLDAPRGYVKFELPYLSSLDINKIDSMGDRLPFFVAPLNFKPPFGYAKIPFPPPHIGSVVVSSKLPNVPSSTEFVPFTLTMTSQLPTEVNSLQPSVSSTTQRGTDRPQKSTDATPTTTPKRNRQRKPLHRGTLSSFSTSTPSNDITERKRDHFTTPAADLQRLPESTLSTVEQPQFSESTPTPVRHKFSRKPAVEHTTVFETTQASIQQQQQFDNSQQQQFNNPQQQQFDDLHQEQFDSPKQHQFDNQQQQQFNNPEQHFFNLNQQQFDSPKQQQFDSLNQFDSPKQHQFENPKQQQFDNLNQQQFDSPKQHQFENPKQPQFENPKQQQFESPKQQQFDNLNQQQFENPKQQQFESPKQQQFERPKQQQFDNLNQQQFESPKKHQFEKPKQPQFENPKQQQFESPKQQQFDNLNQQQFESPKQHQFENPKQQQFESPKQQQFDNLNQQQFDSPKQQQFDNAQQQQFDNQKQQFFADQQAPQTQSDYLNSLPQVTQPQFFNNQQQPSQETFFENQQSPSQQTYIDSQPLPSQQPFFENQQYLENSPQTVQEQSSNNSPQSFTDNPQFISSSTEKQIFKNFQQIQPLSQYQVGNNFLNQQQSSTEQIQSASNPPQTVSIEPQTVVTVSTTDAPKFRQRLSYYDKLLMSSTQAPAVEYTSAQNFIETSEKPRERTKLRPRQRTTTTTRKPMTESPITSEEIFEQVTVEPSTQRYNPLKRRRPVSTTTTSTTEQTEVTRNPLRSRTTQAGRSDFVRSRSRRPTTTTTTTTPTTTTTEEVVQAQQLYEEVNNAQITGIDEQKKIEEAASFWNEPVTIQQSHGYELDTRYTQPPNAAGLDLRFAEPPTAEEESTDKENKYGSEKKAHDPNSEKKGPGRRGHWVRVRVKKPQDNLDTAESQNSLGPLSANAVRELVTKPTHELSDAAELVTTTPETEPTPVTPLTTTTVAATTTTTTTTTTTETPSTTTAAAFTGGLPLTTIDYTPDGVGVTEEHQAEITTVLPPPSSSEQQQQTGAKYPDDEQDEAFQRNLADMLAKFIGDGSNQQQPQETATVQADESTAETPQYAGSDAELTVTPPTAASTGPVTDVPVAPVTSTTTKVSMETEICYKGRCVKSKKTKQITDLVSEP